jgi:hypothetical protein
LTLSDQNLTQFQNYYERKEKKNRNEKILIKSLIKRAKEMKIEYKFNYKLNDNNKIDEEYDRKSKKLGSSSGSKYISGSTRNIIFNENLINEESNSSKSNSGNDLIENNVKN